MITVLLVVHLVVTLALIGVVLIQRSEGGGLGVGTSQGMGSFMSGRGTANLLTRTTAILAAAFFVLSMALALLNRGTTVRNSTSILDAPPAATTPVLPATPAPAAPAPATRAPAAPAPPSPAPAATVPAPAPVSPTATAPETPATTAPAAPATPAPTRP